MPVAEVTVEVPMPAVVVEVPPVVVPEVPMAMVSVAMVAFAAADLLNERFRAGGGLRALGAR